ncbi:MAG: AraC family transcriptional regulator [Ignavibacteria bacterium]
MHTELYKNIIRAKNFIEKRYRDEIDISSIAREACVSDYHFIRTFKKIYKKTPHRYLTEKRIEKARELLGVSEQTVTDICFEVGFSSPGSFSTLFTRYVGYPPAVYRMQRQKKTLLSEKFPKKVIPNCFLIMNKTL